MRIWGCKRVKILIIYKTSNWIVEKTVLQKFLKSRFSTIFGIFTFWGPLLAILRMFEGWICSLSSFTTPALDCMCYPKQNNTAPHMKLLYPTDHVVPHMVPWDSQCGLCCHNGNTTKSVFCVFWSYTVLKTSGINFRGSECVFEVENVLRYP